MSELVRCTGCERDIYRGASRCPYCSVPQRGGGSNAMVVGVVFAVLGGLVVFVMVVGILAAIAIPAYHEYTLRAKVMATLSATAPAKTSVEEYIYEEQAFPRHADDVDVARVEAEHAERISVGHGGVITIEFGPSAGAIAGETMTLEPGVEGDRLVWHCRGGSLDERYRPRTCR